MWRSDTWSIPTYGANGEIFKLKLKFHDWYGYNHSNFDEVVEAMWNSTCEMFLEKKPQRLSKVRIS
mgnify:FL=1